MVNGIDKLMSAASAAGGQNGCERKIKFSYSEAEIYLSNAFDKYTPRVGSSKTLYGELVRAINRIGYRFNNSGDMIDKGYGEETCSPAARFIDLKVKDSKVGTILSGMRYTSSEWEYERLLKSLVIAMAEYLEINKEDLLSVEGDDLWDY